MFKNSPGVTTPSPNRTRTAEFHTPCQKIVIALSETIRLMAEIENVIETHGGWPLN